MRRYSFASHILFCLLLIGGLPSYAEDPESRGWDFVEDQIEMTLFDLYLGNEFKGMIIAQYTDEWFEVENPKDIVEQIPEILNHEGFLPLLQGRIERTRTVQELGTFSYDLNNFIIRVEPAEGFLESQDINLLRRVPDPERTFSLQQRFGVAASGEISEDLNTTLTHRTLASIGKYFARADGAVIQDSSYELTEGVVGGIVSDYEFGIGLLQTQGMQFAPSTQFAGFGIRTSEDLFLDQDLIRGSRLEVFVPGRATVEFFRGGRLLSVQILEFGLQEIDTRAFPQGSYDVEIVITEDSGQITRETKFFTKSGFLASRTQPLYSLDIGAIRDRLTLLDKPVYQAGVRMRATNFLEVGASAYGTDDISFGALELRGLYRELLFGAQTNMSTKGDIGVAGDANISLFGFNFNSRFSETLKSQSSTVPSLTEPEDPESSDLFEEELAAAFSPTRRRRDLMFQDRSSLSANLTKSIGRVDLRYTGESNRTEDQPKRYNLGPSVILRVIDGMNTSLRLQSSYITRDQDTIFNSSILGRYRLNQSWAIDGQLTYRDIATRGSGGGDREEILLFTRLTYDGRTGRARRGSLLSVSNELRQDSRSDQTRSTVINQARYEHTGSLLQSSGFLRDTQQSGGGVTTVGVNAQSAFYLTGDGGFSVAPPVGNEAAIIAEIQSNSSDNIFDVRINNQLYDTVRAGEKSVLGVTPYRTYRISIRPHDSGSIVDYDSSIRTATLFPGNVAREVFNADRVFIALGRLIDSSGEPIAHQRIRGPREYTATEEDGSFQMEIAGHEELYVESRQYNCKLDLKIDEIPEYFIELGEITCQ